MSVADRLADPRRPMRPRAIVWSSLAAALMCLMALFAIGAAPDRGEGTTRPSRVPVAERDEPAPRAVAQRPQPGVARDTANGPPQPLRPRNAKRPAPSTQPAGRATATGFHPTRVVAALGIVLGLILVLRWFGRRFFGVAGPGRSTRAVQVLSRAPLSPKQNLVLIRVGRRLLVCADGGGQMNTLSEITDADEVAALLGQLQDDHADRANRTFGSLFGKMRGNFERDPDGAGTTNGDSDGAVTTAHDDNDDDAELRSRPGVAAARERAGEDDPAVESTRQELSGLMDKVRMLSRQFKSP